MQNLFKIVLGGIALSSLSFMHLSAIQMQTKSASLDAFIAEAFEEPLPREAFQNSQAPTKPEPVQIKEPFKTLQEVSFTTQAPFADWDDPRQQDACEEASVLMAINWAQGNPPLDPAESLNTLLRMSKFQEENYGVYKDTSAKDTYDWLVRGFFQHDKSSFQTNITIHDIIDELYQGNLVIIPTNGQVLQNPNFVGDGPPTHMILLTGYDPNKEEFISNDPGTRNGLGFRYSKKNIANSIRDYGTGYHAFEEDLPTSMIVISR